VAVNFKAYEMFIYGDITVLIQYVKWAKNSNTVEQFINCLATAHSVWTNTQVTLSI